MKRILNIMLSLLILFSFSLHVSSQSDQKDLDQVKLLQQYAGTWESITGKDSILLAKMIPMGTGFIMNLEWKDQGKTFYRSEGLLGLFNENSMIVMHAMWQNGSMATEIGRFVSETKLMTERFLEGQPHHAVLLAETEFINPDTFTSTYYVRGKNITWEPQQELKWTFTRVKE